MTNYQKENIRQNRKALVNNEEKYRGNNHAYSFGKAQN